MTTIGTYSSWNRWGQGLYGLLFPLLFVGWFILSPTKITHGEWGIILVALYYAYVGRVAFFRWRKMPMKISMKEGSLILEYLCRGQTVVAFTDVKEIAHQHFRGLNFKIPFDDVVVICRDGANSPLYLNANLREGIGEFLKNLSERGLPARLEVDK